MTSSALGMKPRTSNQITTPTVNFAARDASALFEYNVTTNVALRHLHERE
jgi:hypothetical protein